MPRPLRMALTALSFFIFFVGSLLIGLLLFPPLRLVIWNRERFRTVCSGLLHRGYPKFLFWARLIGLLDFEPLEVPDQVPEAQPFVMVANHPTLLDVVFLLARVRGLTTVVKSEWYRSAFFGVLLRSTHYIPGPDDRIDQGELLAALKRFGDHLRAGHPLLIFPEGTRSLPDKLRRFHRGAFEAAKAAGVPIVPVFIEVDRAFLTKGVSPLRVPPKRANYRFRCLPVVDTRTDPRSASELRRDFQSMYEAEYQAALTRRLDVPRRAADQSPTIGPPASEQHQATSPLRVHD